MMAKMSLEFDGLKDLLYQISEVESALKPAVDDALTQVQNFVQGQTRQAAAKYVKGGTEYSTGRMRAAIKPNDGPKWTGDVASVGVGFDIYAAGGGGMHSIWIMYGTPRIKPDTKLHNAVRGAKTQYEIREIMEKALREHVKLDYK